MTARDLAAGLRATAGAEPHMPGGTLTRRAALCAAVAVEATTTTTAARKLLAGWDGPPEVRDAALGLLDKITTKEGIR